MNGIDDLYRSQPNHETENQIEKAFAGYQQFNRISIHAFYGIVELSGVALSYRDKKLAIQIARHVPGVTTVLESIRIEERSANFHRRTRHRRYRLSLNQRENPSSPHCHFEPTSTRGRSLIEPGMSSFSPFRG